MVHIDVNHRIAGLMNYWQTSRLDRSGYGRSHANTLKNTSVEDPVYSHLALSPPTIVSGLLNRRTITALGSPSRGTGFIVPMGSSSTLIGFLSGGSRHLVSIKYSLRRPP